MKKVFLFVFALVILIAAFYSYEKREAKILFVGDMNFDRYIRQVGNSKGEDFVFSCIDNFLKDSDLVVGNLEGPITDNPSISMGSEVGSSTNFVFTFPPATAKLLARNNIKIVNLGNNHMLNLSRDGLLQTKKYLEEAEVGYFGDPDSVENEKVARIDIGGMPISLVNWSDWNSDSTDITAAQIKKETESGRKVFVYTHWGEEYVPPPERVKKLARSFIDAGAEMVVGSHPHIVQEKEVYKNKFIYYSLGNFIFDQYWNEEVSTGLVLEVNISGGKINIIEHKVTLNRDGRTCLVK